TPGTAQRAVPTRLNIAHSSSSTHAHHRLDYPCLRLQPIWEFANHGFEVGMMRNPPARIDPAVLNQLDYAVEIRRQRVTAGQHRQLAPVQDRGRREGNRLRSDAYIHQPPGEGAAVQ